MKDNEKDFLDEISNDLDNENIELPDALKKENIVSKIKDEDVKPSLKKTKYKRYIALAASLVIVIAAAAVGVNLGGVETRSDLIPQIHSENYGGAPIRSIDDYSEIEKFFTEKQKQYRKQSGGKFNFWNSNKGAGAVTDGDSGMENGAAAGSTSGGSTNEDISAEKNDFGGTNTQVKNVAEADIVKNDGRYIYAVDSNDYNDVVIVDAQDPKNLKAVSKISFSDENRNEHVIEIFKKDDLLVVLTNNFSAAPEPYAENGVARASCYEIGSGNNRVTASIFNIEDKSNPNKINEFSLEGSYISSRLIGNNLYLMTNYVVPIYKDEKELKDSCIPSYYKNEEKIKFPVSSVKLLEENKENTYLCVAVADISNKDKAVNTMAVLGGGSECYSTENKLFLSRTYYKTPETKKDNNDDVVSNDSPVASSSNNNGNPKTQIFMFDIGDDVKFNCFGEVDGTVLNQFSMDEYNGYFRIATTIGFNSSNSITVLDSKLQKVGEIKDLAKGERIYSVRFLGDTAYAVTFKQTDPLFVLDLKNPAEPKVLGELKIPGFSNYLHPYSDKYIIGIGPDGTETGTNGNLKVSLFDISDKANPKEVSKATYRGQNVHSEIQTSHKAYLTINSTNEFAIPIFKNIYKENKYSYDSYLSTLIVEEGSLKITGKYGEGEKSGANNPETVHRGTYIGSTMFTISNKSVTAYDKATGEILSKADIN